MKKLYYKFLCWFKGRHFAVSCWENQYAIGYSCKCGLKCIIHRNKYTDKYKTGKTFCIVRNHPYELGK